MNFEEVINLVVIPQNVKVERVVWKQFKNKTFSQAGPAFKEGFRKFS